MRGALLIFIVLITLSSVSSQKWQEVLSPGGGKIFQLVIDETNSSKMYAVTVRGIYKSEDSAKTWKIIPNTSNFRKIALADGIYACGPDGISDLNDDAITILSDKFKDCSALLYDNGKLYISLDSEYPEPPKILIYDTREKTWRYISPKNNLFNFSEPIDFPFQIYYRIRNLAVNGKDILASVYFDAGGESETFFESTEPDAGGSGEFSQSILLKSYNLGKDWCIVNLPIKKDIILSSITKDYDGHVLLAMRHKYHLEPRLNISELILESYDFGETWNKINASFMTNGLNDILKMNETYFFSLIDQGLIRYENQRTELFNISNVDNIRSNMFRLSDLAFGTNTNMFYGTGMYNFGIFKTGDFEHWEKADNGIRALSPSIVAISQNDPSNIIISSNVGQIPYLTVDGGTNWYQIPLDARYLFSDEVKYEGKYAWIMNEFMSLSKIDTYDLSTEETSPKFTSAKVVSIEEGNLTTISSNKGICVSYKKEDGSWQCLEKSPDYSYTILYHDDEIYAASSPKSFENESRIMKYSEPANDWTLLFNMTSSGITSLVSDPNDDEKLYAGITGKEGTIYASEDKGKIWHILNNDLTFTTIWGQSQLQIDPKNKSTVYAGTWGGGTYKTINGGKDWALLDENNTFSPTCIVIDEKNPDIVYACDRTLPLIHRSTDAGRTWDIYYDFGIGYMMTSAVAIDPNDADIIYAAAFKPPMAQTGGLFRIKNKKAVDIGKGLPRSVIEIEIDPKEKNRIYVSTHVHGVYTSYDSGKTWAQLDDKNNGLPRIGFYDVDIDPSDNNILYATALCGKLPEYMMPLKIIQFLSGFRNLDSGSCGAYKSTDKGKTWKLILKTISEARGIDIDANNPRNLYVADMMGGVWVSNDAGENWRQENSGLGSISMTSVKIRENYIYASTQGSGVYSGIVQGNGSILWDKSRSNKPKANIYKIQIAVDPGNSSRIYASSYPGGLFRSDDSGKNWNDKNFLTPSIKVEDPISQGYYFFDIDPKDTRNILLGVYGKGMFVSHDGMDYNMFANGNFDTMKGKHITSVEINPGNSDEVFVSSDEGIYVSVDKGKNWKDMNSGLASKKVTIIKVINSQVYAGTSGYGIYKLDRIKKKWVSQEPTYSPGFWDIWDRRRYFFSSMLFDSENKNRIYMGNFPSGFFVSNNAGKDWEDSSLGIGNDGMFSLAQDPSNPKLLYGGTYNGIVKSTDKGSTWSKINNGIPTEQWPFTIAIDITNSSILYATTKNGQNKGFCYRNEFCGLVLKSIDGGESWFNIMNGLDNRSEFYNIIVYPKNSNILFLSSNKGVYISRNAGKSWQSLNKGLPTSFNQVRYNVADVLALSPDNNYLLLGLMHHGLWKMRIY
ncbi:MAG: hypothetical protein ABIJ34_07020 [archaeon]